MAYEVSRNSIKAYEVAQSSWNVVWPTHEIDDYLLIKVSTGTGTGSWTTPAGTTVISQSTMGQTGLAFYYIKATSTSMADITVTTPSSTGEVHWSLWRDADPTSFLDGSAVNNYGSNTNPSSVVIPAITTTTDGCVIFTATKAAASAASERQLSTREFAYEVNRDVESLCIHYNGQNSAGLVASENPFGNTSRWSVHRFAIRNKSGGQLPPRFTGGLDFQAKNGRNDSPSSPVGLDTRISTFDGKTVDLAGSLTPSDTNTGLSESDMRTATSTSFTTIATSGNVQGFVFPVTSLDFSGPFTFGYATGNLANRAVNGSYFLYLEDGSGNWAGYSLNDLGTLDTGIYYWNFADQTPIDSSGTIDLTDIDYYGFGYTKQGTNTQGRSVTLGDFAKLAPVVLTGGGADAPISGRLIANAQSFQDMPNKSFSQGQSQEVLTYDVQIGDGTNPVYYGKATGHIEYPFNLTRYELQDLDVSFDFYLSASCTVDLRQQTFVSTKVNTFSINALSSTSATWLANSAVISGFQVVGKTGFTWDGANLINGPQIDAKGGIYDSCVISGTLAGASEAAIAFDANSSMTGTVTDVTGTSAGYHIELGASVTALTLTDHVFTGTAGTNKIHVLATSGTVTISVGGTTSLLLSDVTSEGATVVIAAPPAVLTISCPTGGILEIFDNDDSPADHQDRGTTLQTTNPTTGSDVTYSHSKGGDDIIISFYKSGFEELDLPFNLTAFDQSVDLNPLLIPEVNI